MDVSRPIGRISVVTIEKIPIITDRTASHPINGDRVDVGLPPAEVVTVDIGSIPAS